MSSGGIWQAAKRGEGYQLARDSNVVWILAFIGGFCALVFRFYSGRPLLGDSYRKTDATWGQGGRTLLHPKERAPFGWANPHGFCWHRLSERQRAAIRIGLQIIVTALLWDEWDHTLISPSIIHNAFTMAALIYIGWGIQLAIRRGRNYTQDRKTKRDMVNPLKEALAPYLGSNNPADVNLTIYPTRKP